MSDDVGTAIARFSTALTEPLLRGFSSPWAVQSLLRSVGWRSDLPGTAYNTVRAAFTIVDDAQALVLLLEAIYASGEPSSAQIRQLITDAASLIDNLSKIGTTVTTLSIAPFDEAEFRQAFPGDLINLLVVEGLKKELPIVHALLVALGVVRYRMVSPAAGGSASRVLYEQRSIDWAAFASLFSDPEAHFRTLYGVGGALKEIELLTAFERALGPLGVPVRQVPIAAQRAARRAAGDHARELILPIIEGHLPGGGPVALGLIITPVPAQPAAVVDGLLISSLSHGQISTSIDIGPDIALRLTGGFDADGALTAEVSPRGVTVAVNVPNQIDAQAILIGQPEKPWRLIGDADSTRVELAGFVVGIEISGDPTDPEVVALLGTGVTEPEKAFAIVIDLKEGDSFLGTILGTNPQRIEAGGLLRWSSVSGLAFEGGGGFEFDRPMRVEIGPVSIDRLTIALRAAANTGVKLWAAIDGRVEIGPIKATVQRIGIQMRLLTGQLGQPGAVGDLGIAFGFKPPEGLGARVSASVVTGGGFLSIDTDNGRYAGALQLRVGPIGVAAVGLLDTRLPGGVKGYSLLVSISATFPAIQLGYGFTLLGLGGIVGIHRSMDTAALSAGLKSGVLDGLLFPEDPITNAPQIISGIRAVFPPVVDHFVFGPMVRLGWASVLTIDVAIVLAIGGPFKLVILGRLSVALPVPASAVVELHLDIIGYLDLGEKVIAIEGVLRNSRIAAFSISGGLAVRLTWGENSSFGMSMGGFHPRFTPPVGFPTVDRLTIGLAKPDGNPRLSLCSYFAITTNSVQFGAGVDLHASGFGAVITGTAEFNALFIFTPFSFEISFNAHVLVSIGGAALVTVDVDVALSGPEPWHAFATIYFSVIFEYTVHAEITLGEATQAVIAPQDPTEALRAALIDPSNWRATMPGPGVAAVRLRPIDETTGPVLDPLGAASVTQRVVPLNRTITRVGTAPVAGAGRYDVSHIAVGGFDKPYTTLMDRFAPAQYAEYTDDEKLTLPSFEPMAAGFAFENAAAVAGAAMDGGDDLLTVVMDADDPPTVAAPPTGFAVAAIERMRSLGVRSGDAETAFPPGPTLVGLAPEQFAITRRATATAANDTRFSSRGGALDTLRRQGVAGGVTGARATGLDVAPAHEVTV